MPYVVNKAPSLDISRSYQLTALSEHSVMFDVIVVNIFLLHEQICKLGANRDKSR